MEEGPHRSGLTEDRIPQQGPSAAEDASADSQPGNPAEGGSDAVRPRAPPPLEGAKVTHLVSPEQSESHLLRGEFVIGRVSGDLQLPDDPYLSSEHVAIRAQDGGYVLVDLGSTNGTFVRIASEYVLDEGDELMMGQQFLRFTLGLSGVGEEGDARGRTRTLGFGSMAPRLVRILEGGESGISWSLARPRTVIGREQGDITFREDGRLSSVHASVLRDADSTSFRVKDEGSRNGTFLRIRQHWRLGDGDYFTVGRQFFRFDLAATKFAGQSTVPIDLDHTPVR